MQSFPVFIVRTNKLKFVLGQKLSLRVMIMLGREPKIREHLNNWLSEKLQQQVRHHILSQNLKTMNLWVLHIIYSLLNQFLTNVGFHRSYLKIQYPLPSSVKPHTVYFPPQWKPFQVLNDVNKSHIYSLYLYCQYLQSVVFGIHLVKKTFDIRDPTPRTNNHH